MTQDAPVSRWAQSRFGDRAHQVQQAVVDALVGALDDAQNAQQVSKSGTRHTFGATVMARKHERLAAELGDMDGARLVRTAGSPFPLVLVNGCLLFPFRYAQDAKVPIRDARVTDRRVSGRVRAIFTRLAPRPAYEQGLLFPEDSEQESEIADLGPAFDELPQDTKLVLIAFAGNDQAGLISIWWGEADLLDEYGRLRWTSPAEQLRLPAEAQVRPVLNPTSAETAARFDSGDIPPLTTEVRPPAEHDARQDVAPDDEGAPGDPGTATDEQQ